MSETEIFGLSEGSAQAQMHEYWGVAVRRKWWIVLTTVAVFVATTVVVLRLPNIYRAETVIMVDPQKVPDNYVVSTVSASIADRLSTIQQQVMSPTRLKKLIDSMNLYPESRGKVHEQDIIRMMQNATTLEVVDPGGRRLSTFRIAFHGRDPVQVAKVVEQLAGLFIEENLKVREQQFQGTADFLNNELQQTKAGLERKEQELTNIKSQYVLDIPESRQYHIEALSNLRAQHRNASERMNRAQQEKVYYQSLIATTYPAIDLDTGAPRSGTAPQSQVQKLEANLVDLRARYGPNHPEVRKIQSQLDGLRAKAENEAEAAPAAAEAPVEPARPLIRNPVILGEMKRLDQEITEQTKLQRQLEAQIDFHASKLQQVPIFEQRISGLMRDYDTLRAHYSSLLDKKLSAEMATALEIRQKGERFVILDPAMVPERPFAPNRPLIALAGLLGGLLGGIGLAVMVEIADESVRNEREAARIVGKPVLVGVPKVHSPGEEKRKRFLTGAALTGTVACAILVGLLISYLSGRLF